MPNTLAHLGIQTLAARAVYRRAELSWIWLGCLIPDVPWILQRILRALPLGLDPYELRLYAIAQSSFALSCVLGFAFAAVSGTPRRVAGLLASMTLLHLLLDATQTKWANGVHLFAPASWELLNLGLYWPESLATSLLTLLGAGVAAYFWHQDRHVEPAFVVTRLRLLLATGILGLYLLLPMALEEGPLRADNHSVRTLRSAARTGRQVAFDRNQYLSGPEGDRIVTLAGEELQIDGVTRGVSGTISARGLFVAQNRVVIQELHVHRRGLRALWSYLGLGLVIWIWLRSAIRPAHSGANPSE